MKHIGIYSGTFDPIHEGHLAFANQAIVQCGLDKVFFLVEPKPRKKQGVRALEHREAMVRLVIADRDEFGMIILEQTNFTVEQTLPKLQALFEGTQLYMLMGSDVFGHLSGWPHVENLLDSCSFIVGLRKDENEAAIRQDIQALQQVRGLTFDVDFIIAQHHLVSSSKIRQAFKRGWQPKGLLPQTQNYIDDYGLYAKQE